MRNSFRLPLFFGFVAWWVCASAIVPSLARASPELSWTLNSRFRYGVRSAQLGEIATLQHQSVFLAESQVSEAWSYQLGMRLRGDGAYSLNRTRYQDLERNDPPEFELREANFEYRSENLIVRIGSQIVPWGEAFGSFYADILNPKDLREAGFGDLADLRNPVEMLNFKYIQNTWSLQTIYVPFYRSNRLPRPSSDFFPSYLKERLKSLTIDFDQSASPEDVSGDIGGRLQFQINALDVSLFGFNYVDRQPISKVNLTGPTAAQVRSRSLRLQSYGLTMNWAGDVIVLRSEIVRSTNRGFNVLGVSPAEPIQFARAAQDAVVMGIDWPLQSGPLKDWQIGLQYSFDRLDISNALGRGSEESVVGLQLTKDQEYGASYRLLSGYSPSDSSALLQAMVMYPHNQSLSWGFDIWLFEGASDTQFGSLREGSRFMFVLKGVFSG